MIALRGSNECYTVVIKDFNFLIVISGFDCLSILFNIIKYCFSSNNNLNKLKIFLSLNFYLSNFLK